MTFREKLFENLIKEFQEYPFTNGEHDYKLSWITCNGDFTLTIADDIRDCSGEELYKAFMELFKAFDMAGIYINSCAVEWKDEWANGKLFRITQKCADERIIFEVRNTQKDKIEKLDVFKYDYDNDRLVKEEFLSFDGLEDEE